MANARRFLRWAGIALARRAKPARTSRHRACAHWNGTTLTFDDGTFALDGNAAVGLLAVTARAAPAHRAARSPSTGSRSIPISGAKRDARGGGSRCIDWASAQIFRCGFAHLGGGDHRPRRSSWGAAGSPSAPRRFGRERGGRARVLRRLGVRAASASTCRKTATKATATATISSTCRSMTACSTLGARCPGQRDWRGQEPSCRPRAALTTT